VELSLLAPPFFAAAILVVLSGLAKLRRPGPAIRALRSLRLPFGPWTVRAIGGAELLIGLMCLVAPSRPSAVALAVLYAAFAGFLVLVIGARVPGASCGCLGDHEAPPTFPHVLLNVVAVATAALVAVAPPQGIIAFSAGQPMLGLPFLLGTALIAYLAYLAAAFLPELFTSYAGRTSGSAPSSQPRPFRLGARAE
jgi:hypothetical protein